MNRLHRTGLVLAGIAVTLLNVAVTLPASASSVRPLPPNDPGPLPAQPVDPVVRTIVVGGTPGWQIALIAIAASLLAATAAVLATGSGRSGSGCVRSGREHGVRLIRPG